MSCQSIYLTRNPRVKMLSKVESHNIFMYIRLPTSHGDYARPVPSGCFFENIHDNQILSTWSTGQHVANLKFQNRFLDSYSILLLLLIGLPWRLLKHMHSQLYTLEEVSPWCDIADVFDAPLNWFAWSKRNSDTLHELLILYTQKQDTSTQIFFSKNTFHYNRVVHTMCMWR